MQPASARRREWGVVRATVFETVLGEALGDPGARARREAALAADPRSPDEVAAPLADLDALIASLTQRLAELERAEAEGIEELDIEEVHDLDEVVEVDPDMIVVATDDAGLGADAMTSDGADPGMAAPRKGRRKRAPSDAARQTANLLYEDVLWLLAINDGEGALISLERLLVRGEPSGELKEFLDLNEAKLLNLYEGFIGPFDVVLQRATPSANAEMPTAFTATTRVAALLGRIDGKTSIAKLIKASPYTPLETCCVLSQLRRAGLVKA